MKAPRRWTTLLLIGLGLYILGGTAGFFTHRWDSTALIATFLLGIIAGGITSLTAMVF